MTSAELLKLLNEIHWQRMLEAHHDSYDLHQPDLEALDSVINLIKFLDEKNPSDKITVAELLKVANIEK